jgi:hypothetical protein
MLAENSVVLTPMTEIEARELVEEIKIGISTVGQKLLELYEREGWRALGYSTWRDCVMTEFDFQQSHVYRLLDFARVERNLSPIGGNYPLPTNERQGRALGKLEPDVQREAWQKAVDTAPNGKVTARHVETVVKEFQADPAPPAIIQSNKPIMAKAILGGAIIYSKWRCEHCSVRQSAGRRYTIVQLEKEQRRICDTCLGLFQVEEIASEFTCPRCGQRTLKLNGKVLCLNESCQAKWESRVEFDEELQEMDTELHLLRMELKTNLVSLINRLPPDELKEFAAYLAGWRQPTERTPL